MNWRSFLRFFRGSSTSGTIRTRQRHCRPRLELLEDRLAPAAFVVTNLTDALPGSLRAAIAAANATAAADTITFAVPANSTINVTSAPLTIANPLTITGPGAGLLKLDGGTTMQIFNVTDGNAGTSLNVTISGLTLTRGFVPAAGLGGAIQNDENLTVNNSILSANVAGTDGGGIYNSGKLTVNNSTITGNSAGVGCGGGIQNIAAGILTVTNSTISNNSANTDDGGGIMNDGGIATITNSTLSGNTAVLGGAGIGNTGMLTVVNSTISGNTVSSGSGGGIENSGTLTVVNSTLAGNSATNEGGGIFSNGTLTVANSNFTGNFANAGGGIHNYAAMSVTNSTFSRNTAVSGGGIYNNGGTGTVTNSTFSGNSASNDGGGIGTSGGTLAVTGSTISGNSASGSGGGIYNLAGTLTVTNSTVSGNSAVGAGGSHGGGIANSSGTFAVINSTVSGNSATGFGGGIINQDTLLVTNSTIVANRGDSDGVGGETGGGIHSSGPVSTTLFNTIVAGNLATPGAGTPADLTGTSVQGTSANNLIGDPATAGGLTHGNLGNILGNGAGSLLPLASILDTILRNNGGATHTHALIPGSVAINAGDNANALDPGPNGVLGGGDDVALTTDQRGPGFLRIIHTTVDIGAYEMPRATFTDNFDRSNSAAVGAPWFNRAGALGIVTNQAQGTGVATVHLSTLDGAAAADVDLYASVSLQNSQAAGLIARYAGAADMNHYLGALQKDAEGNVFAKIMKNVAGVISELAVVEGVSAAGTLRFRVAGSTLQLFLNGTLLATVRDASFKTGGFGVRTLGMTRLDNFQAWPLSIGLDHFDAFTRPDDSALGGPWARIAGTYTVQGNEIQGLDATNLAIIDGATRADVDVRASINITGLNHQAGLVARFKDASNYYLARLTRTATGLSAVLLKNVAGVSTTLMTVAIPTSSGKATLRFVATGTTLRVFVNSRLWIDMQDITFSTGAVGIRSDNFSTLDDFRVLTVTTALPFADNFDQADGTELGINWTRRAGNFKIVSNQAVGTLASPSANLATLVGVNAHSIEVQATITLATVGNEIGLVANYGGPGNANYYLGRVVKTAAGHALSIQKNLAGVVTTLGAVFNVVGALTGPIKLQVLGTTLKLFMNGVPMLTRNDTSLIRGSAGLRSIGTGTINDFSATELNFLPFTDVAPFSTITDNGIIQAGNYTVNGNNEFVGTTPLNVATLARLNVADVEGRATIGLANIAGRHASLVARYTGSGDLTSSMYLATISRNATDYIVSIQKRVNGVTTTLKTKVFSAFDGDLEVLMKFTVIGGELKLFIGNVEELSVFDFSLKTGTMGFRSSIASTYDLITATTAS